MPAVPFAGCELGVHFRAVELGEGEAELAFHLAHARLELGGVDLGEELTLVHPIVEVHMNVEEPAGDLAPHVYGLPCFQSSRRGHGDRELAPLGRGALVTRPFLVAARARDGDPRPKAQHEQGDGSSSPPAPAPRAGLFAQAARDVFVDGCFPGRRVALRIALPVPIPSGHPLLRIVHAAWSKNAAGVGP